MGNDRLKKDGWGNVLLLGEYWWKKFGGTRLMGQHALDKVDETRSRLVDTDWLKLSGLKFCRSFCGLSDRLVAHVCFLFVAA